MFITFLTWLGGYAFIGMISCLMNFKQVYDLFKDNNRSETEFNEVCSLLLITGVAWPIVIPAISYIAITDKILQRYEKKLRSETEYQACLLHFLHSIEVISEDTYRRSVNSSHRSRQKKAEAKRKKFGL